MRKQKMTKHCYLYVYHRRYIPSYICIILSDEGFANTEHTFQRIQCTRWHCPSWQYGCHIATPLTCSVKLKQSQWSCRQMRYFINAAINTDDYCCSIEYSSWPWLCKVVVAVLHAFFNWPWQSSQCGWHFGCPSLTVSIFRSFCLQQSEGKFWRQWSGICGSGWQRYHWWWLKQFWH